MAEEKKLKSVMGATTEMLRKRKEEFEQAQKDILGMEQQAKRQGYAIPRPATISPEATEGKRLMELISRPKAAKFTEDERALMKKHGFGDM